MEEYIDSFEHLVIIIENLTDDFSMRYFIIGIKRN